MKVLFAIPTYKNRQRCLFDMLPDLPEDWDIILFLSEGDEKLEEYKAYCVKPNITLNITTCKTIFEKRNFLLQYAFDNNYDICITCDDDIYKIYKAVERCNGNPSNKNIETTLADLILECIKTLLKYNAGIVGPTLFGFLGVAKMQASYNCPNLLFVINCNRLKEANINYRIDIPYGEDTSLCIDCAKAGIKVLQLKYYAIKVNDIKTKQSVVFSTYSDRAKLIMKRMAMMHGKLLKIDKDGTLKFMEPPLSWYYSHPNLLPPIDPELLNIFELGDIEAAKQYYYKNKVKKLCQQKKKH